MRSKIFNTPTILFIALIVITIKSYGQEAQPAAKVTVTTKTSVTSKSTSTSKVSAAPKVAVKSPMVESIIIEPVKVEPTVISITPDVSAAPSVRVFTSMKDGTRALTRKLTAISGKQINRIRLRVRDYRNTPDSPAEAANLPAVAYGFKEQSGGEQSREQQTTTTEQVKDYSRTYTVDANDKLQIDNSFGNIMVNTWNRNEFKVDVHIRVTANEGDVTIVDSKKGSLVSFKTNINQRGRTWIGGRRGSSNIIVNYMIYMPAKNPLEITNRFGAINLPDLNGRVVINCEHGSLIAKSLTSAGNIINVSYGNTNIENLRESDLNAEYGSVIVANADKLNANISYTTIAKIGRIGISGNINSKYGSGLQIGDVSKELKNLTINSDYNDVKVGINNGENANFDVTIHNGSFNYGSNIYVAHKDSGDKKTKWSPTQNFKGHVGKGNGNKVIFINSSYSTVKFD
jgi:hypothetical protein